jgi:hypothetical protein
MNFLNLSLVLASSATLCILELPRQAELGRLNTFITASKVMEVALFAPVFLSCGPREGDAPLRAGLIVVARARSRSNYVALARATGPVTCRSSSDCARRDAALPPPFRFPRLPGHVSDQLDGDRQCDVRHRIAGPAGVRRECRPGGGRTLRSRDRLALLAAHGRLHHPGQARGAALPMFTYFYAYTAATALLCVAYLAKRYSLAELNSE